MSDMETRDDLPVRLGALAATIGRGLAAGFAGTAAMTASALVETQLRGRGPSTTPARAAGRVLGVAPVDERGEQRFNRIVHWAYGTAWGGVRGLLAGVGVRPPVADVAHLAVVWGAEQVVVPGTGAGTAAAHGPARDAAADVVHHAIYAVVTGLTYRWLERR